MSYATLAPGLYREDRVVAPAASPRGGVPGFAGFGPATTAPLRIDDAREIGALLPAGGDSYLAAALRGFFDNGGQRCVVALGPAGAGEVGLLAAFRQLATVEEIDLLACPDAMCLARADAAAILRVQRALLDQCAAMRTCFGILDALPGRSVEGLLAQRRDLALGLVEPVNGALYAPWLKDQDGLLQPPSGHVAGVYAKTDAASGPHVTPAGMALAGAVELELGLDAAMQATLNAAGINALRAFPGRGIRVWGARTLSAAPEWRYVNTRRLVLTLIRWTRANMGWTAFEPNTPATWARIERALRGRLDTLWQTGALQGERAEDAYVVRCDGTTNPATSRDGGVMVAEIAIAPAVPAEFVVLRLTLHAEGGA